MPNPAPISPADIARTLAAARQARAQAYAPYSNFKVGSAIFTQDGQVITGCNVEIATWEEATCAERTAIASAVTQGHANERRDFIRLVVVSTQAAAYKVPLTLISPCGACRQVISDFCNPDECTVLMDDGHDGHSFSFSELLKHGFNYSQHTPKQPRMNCDLVEKTALLNAHTGNLLEAARAIRNNAAQHVQGMPEGAVIITSDGRAFCGASVENSCTALNIRALRSAATRAVAAGAAREGPPFIRQAVIVTPSRGRNQLAALRQAINPALVSEFFADDAEITAQIDDAPPFTIRVGELFGWMKANA